MKTQAFSGKKALLAAALVVVVGGGALLFNKSGSNEFSAIAPTTAGDMGVADDSVMSTRNSSGDGLAYDMEKAAESSALPPVLPGLEATGGGATAVTADGSGSGGAPASQVPDDRKIVQTASIRLEVEEVGAGFEEVGRIAAGAGGFVSSSSFSNQGVSQVASMTIRVPAGQYQSALSELRRLGVRVVAEDSKSSDVTAEYTDLGARLRNLEATETQLLVLLERATTINEILQVQDRLNGVRGEIEQVKGRMGMLDKLTELATITVHLQPSLVAKADGSGSRIGNEISAAWDESIEFLTDVAAAAVHVIVFAWWVPVAGLPLLFIGSRLLRSRPRPVEAVD